MNRKILVCLIPIFLVGCKLPGTSSDPSPAPPASATPSPSPSPTPIVFNQIRTGGNDTCGIATSGRLTCWGLNDAGELGNGTTSDESLPTNIDSGTTYIAVATGSDGGYSHTCGITTSGALKCWGDNLFGELGNGTTTNEESPVVIDSGTTYAAIAVGGNGSEAHTCGITTGGVLKCWGSDTQGELGDGGSSEQNSPIVIHSGTSYTAVSAGNTHTCAITSAGALQCWGQNQYGQLGSGNPVVDSGVSYQSISASYTATCGITTGGVLKCWGTGDLGNNTYSAPQSSPIVIDSGTSYHSVSVGPAAICGITTSNALKCWGVNSWGEVGNGTESAQETPAFIDSGVNYNNVSVGGAQSCGVTTSGVGKCWGANGSGQLGNGTTTSSNTPTAVAP